MMTWDVQGGVEWLHLQSNGDTICHAWVFFEHFPGLGIDWLSILMRFTA